ncbi:hypothetical protein ACEQ8H_002902 [Pleosporales sp. CAS-2024a]
MTAGIKRYSDADSESSRCTSSDDSDEEQSSPLARFPAPKQTAVLIPSDAINMAATRAANVAWPSKKMITISLKVASRAIRYALPDATENWTPGIIFCIVKTILLVLLNTPLRLLGMPRRCFSADSEPLWRVCLFLIQGNQDL